MIEGLSNQRRCQRHVSLGETHQRKAGVRIPSRLVCRDERVLRARDVSGAQANPTELRERPPELPAQIGAQLLTGGKRFLLSLEAGPPQPEDLGPVHAAASVDAPHGLSVAPSFHGLRPFLGDVVLRQCLKRAHHLAVDDSRGERIELTRHRCDGGLVEQVQAARDLALQDQAARLSDATKGRCRVVAACAHVDGYTCPLPGARKVAG